MRLIELSGGWVNADFIVAVDRASDGGVDLETVAGRVRHLQGPDAAAVIAAMEELGRQLGCRRPGPPPGPGEPAVVEVSHKVRSAQ
jgi:hypothetical protein